MIETIDWKKHSNVVPGIIQDFKTHDVLMCGFINKEALKLTIETGKVHFWSHTKNRIWMKGEESGNVLNVVDIKTDCDNDSILILTNPIGNTCHNGTKSCFDYRANFIIQLEDVIEKKIKNPCPESYVSNLCQNGMNKIAQKVGEEATEVVIESIDKNIERLKEESADLLFHFLVLLKYNKLSISEITQILHDRHKEKYPSC